MDMTAPPITAIPDADRFCAVCKKDEVELGGCAKCRSIYYCSKACQKVDWNLHKMLCRAFASDSRPVDADGKPCRRCIFFDANKHAPEIFWVPARGNQSPVLNRLFSPEDHDKYLRGEFDPRSMVHLNKVKAHSTKSKDFVALFSNKMADFGNLAFTAAARKLGEATWGTYKGSVFLVRQIRVDGKSSFEDVTPAEFRAAVQQLSQKLVPDMVALERELGQQTFDDLLAAYSEIERQSC